MGFITIAGLMAPSWIVHKIAMLADVDRGAATQQPPVAKSRPTALGYQPLLHPDLPLAVS